MVDPLNALLYASLFIVIALMLIWPEKGLLWQFRISYKKNIRIRQEDTLKQIYDHEYHNKTATLRSISGALDLSMDKTADVLDKLIKQGLVKFTDAHYTLTPQGRTYALRIIRMHRLWERYYADETGLSETDWHKKAEILEHTTTQVQAEELAQSIGNPMFDPHGDPIPTASGEIFKRESLTINDLEAGDAARITHIEDEPAILYSQLVAFGLYPGMQIYMIEKQNARVSFLAEGEEIVLAPALANHINVKRIQQQISEDEGTQSLADLDIGESAKVASISKACRGIQRRRLMDLGIIPGTKISAELKSSSGNPTAYSIRGATIALRNDQAKLVKINVKKEL